MSGYCAVARGHPLHGPYHDAEHGFPLADDDALLDEGRARTAPGL